MARIQKKDGSLVIRKSFWSAISVWWSFIFLLAIPGGAAYVFLFMDMEPTVNLIALVVGVLSFVVTALVLLLKLICVRKTTWTFYDGAVIYKKGRIFYTEESTRDMEFFPGMSVSVRRTVKGKIFNYGEIILSNGAGEAGEIVMIGAKRPRKVQKLLRQLLAMACTRTANMMSPYKMYPQMYRHVLGGYPSYYYGAMQMQNAQQPKK